MSASPSPASEEAAVAENPSAVSALLAKIPESERPEFRRLIRECSEISHVRSAGKLFIYYGFMALAGWAIIISPNWVCTLLFQCLLGLVFAHGLELQHEALHNSMFRVKWLNRFVGTLFGVPMLVSFTQYKYQHLYHHRHVGTAKDAEIFNYEDNSMRAPTSLVARAFNISRIPALFSNTALYLQGVFPEAFPTLAIRRSLLLEHLGFVALLVSAVIVESRTPGASLILKLWLIPWLLFAEVFHFAIEIPEHVGCERDNRSVLHNTRSYRLPRIVGYIFNYNNYHTEHHLFPTVNASNLNKVHERIEPLLKHNASSYAEAITNVFKH